MTLEIICRHIYRAKRPRFVGLVQEFYNDRQVLFIGPTTVQYDSSTVRRGQTYPSVTREKFEAWAGEDVTEGYPDGDWAEKPEGS